MSSRSEGDSRRPTTASNAEPSMEPKLLDQVLQQTQSIALNDEPLDQAEFAALKDVAKRRRGQPLGSDVAIELVQAIFSLRWSKTLDSPTVLAAMAKQVAETLLDSPASNERMQSLWNRLCEGET